MSGRESSEKRSRSRWGSRRRSRESEFLLRFLLLALAAPPQVRAQCLGPSAFITEFTYDSDPSGSEGAEIFLPPGSSVNDFALVVLGSDGNKKKEENLNEFPANVLPGGGTLVDVRDVSIQNSGAGLVLWQSSCPRVVEFLCLELRFEAAENTVAAGLNCSLVDLTVELASEKISSTRSFQRIGDGTSALWSVEDQTFGQLKAGQSEPASGDCCINCAMAPCTSWPELVEVEESGPATYYLNTASGSDDAVGTSPESALATVDRALSKLQPGDTLLIMGELTNPSYDPQYEFQAVNDSQLWHAENTLKISDVHGAPGQYITFAPFDNTTILRGDGANIIRVQQSSYIKIIGFNVEGEVERIPLSTAKAVQFAYRLNSDYETILYRVNTSLSDEQIGELTLPIFSGSLFTRASYTDTRGIYISDTHHIMLEDNHVHHMPGGGVRCATCEYVDIVGNEVDNCARKSYSGTHGLVLTYTTDNLPMENQANHRARVTRNLVHHNYNEIYSWVSTKDKIHAAIDEGKGVSLQRNQEFQNGGRILVANNIAYWNGYSGFHSNDGDNVDFISNTAYMNSYTSTVTYNNTDKQSGNNIGISISDGKGCRIVNNIAVVDSGFNGFAISFKGEDGAEVNSNLIFGLPVSSSIGLKRDSDLEGIERNTSVEDPRFLAVPMTPAAVDPKLMFYDFALAPDSPARAAAHPDFAVCEDFFQSSRPPLSALGAVEYLSASLPRSWRNLTACYAAPARAEAAENNLPPSSASASASHGSGGDGGGSGSGSGEPPAATPAGSGGNAPGSGGSGGAGGGGGGSGNGNGNGDGNGSGSGGGDGSGSGGGGGDGSGSGSGDGDESDDEEPWGQLRFPSCKLQQSWPQLVAMEADGAISFETGGLGMLTTPGSYEVWVCVNNHPCTPGAPFCFVFDEQAQEFIAWGPNSELKLCP